MERIDTQQTSNKTIPVICETQVRPESNDTAIGASAIQWLSSAMSIWMRDDDAPKRGLRADKGLTLPAC
jgi:hypothetical protein